MALVASLPPTGLQATWNLACAAMLGVTSMNTRMHLSSRGSVPRLLRAVSHAARLLASLRLARHSPGRNRTVGEHSNLSVEQSNKDCTVNSRMSTGQNGGGQTQGHSQRPAQQQRRDPLPLKPEPGPQSKPDWQDRRVFRRSRGAEV
ncbi:hypothetical protein MCOR02_006229 [Pyricularia oryzae]|nr:hypothetical protein MCOR02_006229 [Pyricularia oryzae]KAI6474709.1 hypothetical protein MCOR17_001957 [Pyricularia oryzae]